MPKRDQTIEKLYSQHYDELLRRASILLHDEEDARDAVSEVMARLVATDILPNGEKLVAYARSSVRFECMNRLKRMKLQERMRRALPLDDSETVDTREEEAQYLAYQQFIQMELTPQTRRVFQMHYRDQLKYREIAEQLDISEAAVYKHLSQAVTKLKNRFKS